MSATIIVVLIFKGYSLQSTNTFVFPHIYFLDPKNWKTTKKENKENQKKKRQKQKRKEKKKEELKALKQKLIRSKQLSAQQILISKELNKTLREIDRLYVKLSRIRNTFLFRYNFRNYKSFK